jgi:hypothetical protein
MSILSEFIWKERFQYADVNKLAANLGQASDYCQYLLIILDRYGKESRDYISISEKIAGSMRSSGEPTRLSVEQAKLLEESSQLKTLVHLEIESFYLFAKIFLDMIARFLYMYFGQADKIKLKSHNDLADIYYEYFKVKQLTVPKKLPESIKSLKEIVCEYRDKEISHELSLRKIKSTAWGASKAPIITNGIFYPRPGDTFAKTEELPKLMEDVNKYVQLIIELVESNRIKSRFKLKEK